MTGTSTPGLYSVTTTLGHCGAEGFLKKNFMGMMLACQVEHFSLQQLLYQHASSFLSSCVAGSCVKTESFDAILKALNHCICHCLTGSGRQSRYRQELFQCQILEQ